MTYLLNVISSTPFALFRSISGESSTFLSGTSAPLPFSAKIAALLSRCLEVDQLISHWLARAVQNRLKAEGIEEGKEGNLWKGVEFETNKILYSVKRCETRPSSFFETEATVPIVKNKLVQYSRDEYTVLRIDCQLTIIALQPWGGDFQNWVFPLVYTPSCAHKWRSSFFIFTRLLRMCIVVQWTLYKGVKSYLGQYCHICSFHMAFPTSPGLTIQV